MNIIIGHSNMDMDCLGSMVLARFLYPNYKLIKSQLIHPVARNMYNLYQHHLNMIAAKELAHEQVEKIVVVDTRSYSRIKEYFRYLNHFQGDLEVWDHHPADSQDIEGAVLHHGDYGSNTTLLGLELMKRGITLAKEDATIALAGIYADTGNFSHDNVKQEDFEVATYLMRHHASIHLVNYFLQTLKEKYQIDLFHKILNRLTYRNIHGHLIIFCYLELAEQQGGLAAVVEKVFDVENPDAFFAIFSFLKEKSVLIVARSKKSTVSVDKVMAQFGGGGHSEASSALVKGKSGLTLYGLLEECLYAEILPASCAEDIMSVQVKCVNENKSLLDVSLLLESLNHTGVPVLGIKGELKGFITLRDIMKGRKAEAMKAPVKSYMTRNVITANKETTLREIDFLLYKNNIGHLPIVENNRVIGMVTRSNYLDFVEQKRREGK